MKKLIGIILALCMLTTMAAAATIENANATATLETMTVSVTYTALADNAQATLFAYKVADAATADAIPAYVDQTTTPIVGIDQEASDGTFEFKVATEFRGKIAVKIGGADVAAPVAMLVEFKDAVVEPDEPEMVEVTLAVCGDVNGDGVVTDADANAVMFAAIGGSKVTAGDYNIGAVIKTIVEEGKDDVYILCGDVNGDGSVTDADANAIMFAAIGGSKVTAGKYNIGEEITAMVPKTEE